MFPNIKTIFMTKNYRSSGNILKASNSLIDKNENRIKKDLITNSDLKDESDKVKMMTIHTAKGLEFPYVFIAGLNEGIFPSSRVRTKDEMEEERRLAYVGFTRAEKVLFFLLLILCLIREIL